MLVSYTENLEKPIVEQFQAMRHLWGVTTQLCFVERGKIGDSKCNI